MTQKNSSPDIHELLLRLGYGEAGIRNIIDELDDLLEGIGFNELEQKARAAIDLKDHAGLINTLKELMKRLENKGIYRPDHPTGLIKLLVNGLNRMDEDIFAVIENSRISRKEKRKEQEFIASCAAITQLGYIILSRFIHEVKAASSGPHVFIIIDGSTPDSMIFVDFSIDSILEIDARLYEQRENKQKENNYYLKTLGSDDETSKHIAQYYASFHVTSGIGLSHNIHNNIGMAYDRAEMYENAIEEFNVALRLDEGYIEVLNNLAVTYHRMGMADKAIEKLREALSLRPGYPEAHCNMGNIYASEGKVGEALAEFEAAFTLHPNNALIHFGLGNVYLEQEKIPDAIREFQEALKLDPDHLPARSSLGELYARQGRHDEALREFQEVLNRDPELPEAYHGIGSVYYELGSFDRSANAWIRAVYLDPELLEHVPDKLLLKIKQGVSRIR
ncbi:tetratricopeptide repeat protein [Patescibacteria group bacterium]|nr:tetratricopeptide repeat protein [Patescibacteria group bacterium]